MKNKFARRSKKPNTFKPNRAYVKYATGKYLKEGGLITKLTVDETSYQGFVSNTSIPEADEFLAGSV